MVQTADGSPEEGAGRKDDDMSNPMWVHIIRLLDERRGAGDDGAPDLQAGDDYACDRDGPVRQGQGAARGAYK